MSDLIDNLEKLLLPEIEKFGYELVAVEFNKSGGKWVLSVYIDNNEGISIEDCVKINSIVDEILVKEDPIKQSFTLEVSSPGIFRPLVKPEQYFQHIGDRVKIKFFQALDGRKKFIAHLTEASDDHIKVITEDDNSELEICYDDIAKANLEPVLNF